MKRHGHLFDAIADPANIVRAHERARRGKARVQSAIARIDSDPHGHAVDLSRLLLACEYRTGGYSAMTITERGKERLIHRLPYWPDRVVHHAIVQVLEPIWLPTMIRHTYASIPGRGIHDAARTVRQQLRDDPDGTRYCLKLDVRKFYPSIPHEPLVDLLGRKIKDPRVMTLLGEIVRSIDVTGPGVGVPIGNYLSQWFANLYLSPLDHRIKQVHRVRYYHRYCDDLVLLSGNKERLHAIRADIDEQLASVELDLKGNWQVFPTAARGVDFVGYRMFPTHTLIRKATKKRMAARLSVQRAQRSPAAHARARRSVSSYDGWTRFGNTHNLRAALLDPWLQGP